MEEFNEKISQESATETTSNENNTKPELRSTRTTRETDLYADTQSTKISKKKTFNDYAVVTSTGTDTAEAESSSTEPLQKMNSFPVEPATTISSQRNETAKQNHAETFKRDHGTFVTTASVQEMIREPNLMGGSKRSLSPERKAAISSDHEGPKVQSSTPSVTQFQPTMKTTMNEQGNDHATTQKAPNQPLVQTTVGTSSTVPKTIPSTIVTAMNPPPPISVKPSAGNSLSGNLTTANQTITAQVPAASTRDTEIESGKIDSAIGPNPPKVSFAQQPSAELIAKSSSSNFISKPSQPIPKSVSVQAPTVPARNAKTESEKIGTAIGSDPLKASLTRLPSAEPIPKPGLSVNKPIQTVLKPEMKGNAAVAIEPRNLGAPSSAQIVTSQVPTVSAKEGSKLQPQSAVLSPVATAMKAQQPSTDSANSANAVARQPTQTAGVSSQPAPKSQTRSSIVPKTEGSKIVPQSTAVSSSVAILPPTQPNDGLTIAAAKPPTQPAVNSTKATAMPPPQPTTVNPNIVTTASIPQKAPSAAPASSAAPAIPQKKVVTSPKSVPTGQAHGTESTAVANQTSAAMESKADPKFHNPDTTAAEEALAEARKPLTDLYGPFLCSTTDNSLNDARHRLKTALAQTRKLRQAFTDRVYGKYRVCLRPPPETKDIVEKILQDPARVHQQLKQEISAIREEKDIEKKEAAKLNAEMAQAKDKIPALSTVDNADQLMFLSAGLNLVILPEEQVDPCMLKNYNDRAPINPETGQRVRSISQAAAAAGEVILDRTRKASAMRVERQRRRQLQLLSGGGLAAVDNNYSRIQVLSSAAVPPPPAAQPPKQAPTVSVAATPSQKIVKPQPVPVVAVKAAPLVTSFRTPAPAPKLTRTRHPALSLNVNAIMSLNPRADELKVSGDGSKRKATTAWLIANMASGVAVKTIQQRLKHPHPESLGGMERASMISTTTPPEIPASPLSLPPIPTPNDRLDRKPLQVHTIEEGSAPEAKEQVAQVLKIFTEQGRSEGETSLRPVSKLGLLHCIQKLTENINDGKKSVEPMENSNPLEEVGAKDSSQLVQDSCLQTAMGPSFTLSVLHAIGLVSTSSDSNTSGSNRLILPSVEKENKSFWSDRLSTLREKVESADRGVTETVLGEVDVWAPNFSKRRDIQAENESTNPNKKPRLDESSSEDIQKPKCVPLESIRGGGETTFDAGGENEQAKDEVGADTHSVADDETHGESRHGSQKVPLESIRGGGDVLKKADEESEKETVDRAQVNAGQTFKTRSSPEKIEGRKRAESSPGRPSTAGMPGNTYGQQIPRPTTGANIRAAQNRSGPQASASVVASFSSPPIHQTVAERYYQNSSTMNPFQLPNQFRASHMHHPAAGDLAEYLGSVQQHQQQRRHAYDMLMANGAQPPMSAIGFNQQAASLVGYTLQDRANAARAMIMREQQASALLGGYPQSTSSFPHMHGHHTSMPPLFSAQHPNVLGPGQSPTQSGASQVSSTSTQQQRIQAGSKRKGNIDTDSKPKEKDRIANSTSDLNGPRNASQKSLQNVTDGSNNKGAKFTKSENKQEETVVPPKDPQPIVSTSKNMDSGEKAMETPSVKKQDMSAEKATSAAHTSTNASSENYTLAPKQAADKRVTEIPPVNPGDGDSGKMKFFIPQRPESLSSQQAELIESGNFNKVITSLSDSVQLTSALDHLLAIGAAVPIPKAFVLGPLKERLNNPTFKSGSSSNSPSLPRDVIVAAIVVWLWANHETYFQKAFAKNGRIDVDQDCKWLVNAAVETSVKELTLEVAESVARGIGAFAEAAALRKGQILPKGVSEIDRASVSKRVEISTASIVTKSLAEKAFINSEINLLLPNYQQAVSYLDEARLGAFRAKIRERTLLAALLARKTTMNELFANAYVSSMVRAGEALGHGEVFEIAQNEEVLVSTMIPFDILTDEVGTWEDPCKPPTGFTSGLTGNELIRRAHARAMIQKSLRKFQDRHHIRGGALSVGPYADLGGSQSPGAGIGSSAERTQSSLISPRGGSNKRRVYAMVEPPVPPGTGAFPAKSWSVYDPIHFSSPLEWDTSLIQNAPYGVHLRGAKKRALGSTTGFRSGEPRNVKRVKRPLHPQAPVLGSADKIEPDGKMVRSTHEIDWAEVAAVFHKVKLPKKAPSSRSVSHHHVQHKPGPDGKIYAPFCRRIQDLKVDSDNDESDTEEDLTEETTLQRHQIVLDKMKDQLSAYMEARKKQQERRKKTNK